MASNHEDDDERTSSGGQSGSGNKRRRVISDKSQHTMLSKAAEKQTLLDFDANLNFVVSTPRNHP
eukprot:1971811-Alexandrium_andersonii.AAC.1